MKIEAHNRTNFSLSLVLLIAFTFLLQGCFKPDNDGRYSFGALAKAQAIVVSRYYYGEAYINYNYDRKPKCYKHIDFLEKINVENNLSLYKEICGLGNFIEAKADSIILDRYRYVIEYVSNNCDKLSAYISANIHDKARIKSDFMALRERDANARTDNHLLFLTYLDRINIRSIDYECKGNILRVTTKFTI